MKLKIVLSLSVFVVSFAFVSFAYAETVSFNVDGSFDWQGMGQRSATLRHEGANVKWYVSDDYWDSRSPFQQTKFLQDLQNLSNEFDLVTYPELTALFGSENKPGVDGDPKITIFLTRMQDGVGGYFQERDGVAKSQSPLSNVREMIYLNAVHVASPRMRAFMAHEFQHLITFNQKNLEQNIGDEIWLNELRSEVASTILGYDSTSVYQGSNLQARVSSFLANPSDPLLDWGSNEADYASVNLFGQYLLDHYGRSVLGAMMQNNLAGIDSLNSALSSFGFSEDFSDIYTNWTIANLINDCSVVPVDTYCYKNPALGYNNLHVTFESEGSPSDDITKQVSTGDWKSQWFQFTTSLNGARPADHIFKLDFTVNSGSAFRLPYVVYESNGTKVKEVKEAVISNGVGGFEVQNFGFTVPRIEMVPSNQFYKKGTIGLGPSLSYSFSAYTTSESELEKTPVAPPSLADGSLIRALNGYKVYVINGNPSTPSTSSGQASSGRAYKRWIQSAEIFNFYGHFNFQVVQVVDPSVLASYEDSWLIRADGDTKVYEINGDGTRHWLNISAEEFSIRGKKWDMVYVINSAERDWYREGAPVR